MLTFVSSSSESELFSDLFELEGLMSLSSSGGFGSSLLLLTTPVAVVPAPGVSVLSPSYLTYEVFGA